MPHLRACRPRAIVKATPCGRSQRPSKLVGASTHSSTTSSLDDVRLPTRGETHTEMRQVNKVENAIHDTPAEHRGGL